MLSCVQKHPPHPIIDLFRELNIFKRNKKPFELKVLSVLDYIYHGSIRKIASKITVFFEPISKSSLYDWIRAFSSKITIANKRKHRDVIAIDETVIKHNGKKLYFWGAIDCDSKELLAIHVSQYRDSLETLKLLKNALKYCTNKPLVLRDGAPWYNYAFEWLKLKHEHVTFGKRNSIERFFGYVKDRTKVFCNNINTRTLKRGILSVWLLGNLIGFWYQHLR